MCGYLMGVNLSCSDGCLSNVHLVMFGIMDLWQEILIRRGTSA